MKVLSSGSASAEAVYWRRCGGDLGLTPRLGEARLQLEASVRLLCSKTACSRSLAVDCLGQIPLLD